MANDSSAAATQQLREEAQFLVRSAQKIDVSAKIVGVSRVTGGGAAVRIVTTDESVDKVMRQMRSDAPLLSMDCGSDVMSQGVEVIARIGPGSEWKNAGQRAAKSVSVRVFNLLSILVLSTGLWVQAVLAEWAAPVRTPLFSYVLTTTGVDLDTLTRNFTHALGA